LYLITNGFRNVQSNKLKNSGINNFFISVYDSETCGVKKPNPLIFNHALDNSGCIAKESVMIGDSFEADIQGSLAVGMNAIHYINLGEKEHTECIIVNNLLSIKKIL
jgi:putative hydrolase of the HAD superfamily